MIGEKTCCRCDLRLSITEFNKDKRAKSGLDGYCRHCRSELLQSYFANGDYRQRYNARVRVYRGRNLDRALYLECKRRAKKHGIPFDLEPIDISVPEICPILGIPLKMGTGGPEDGSPSVDQIVAGLGYIKGNVQVISHLANRMKSNATPDQLRRFSEWIKKQYGSQKSPTAQSLDTRESAPADQSKHDSQSLARSCVWGRGDESNATRGSTGVAAQGAP